MLNLGLRSHDLGRTFGSASALAECVSSYRENCLLHFAPYKVLPDTPKPFNSQWAASTREDLAKYGVKVAIFGVYIQLMHPDPEREEADIRKFENGMEVANSLGATLIATETGSMDARNVRSEDTWKEENLTRFMKNVERLVRKAEDNHVVMALEAVADKNTLDTPERMFRVMETFRSPNLRCLFDAVNILPIHGVENYEAWYDEALDMLHPYISAMHLKDFLWTESHKEYPYAEGLVKNGYIPLGEGLMPWDKIFALYRKYNLLDVPMTLENYRPETLKESLCYADNLGIRN